MKTLLIDNYDSFTFNLYQLIAEVNREFPIVIKNDQLTWHDLVELNPDNIIISPGPGRPDNERDFGICQEIIAKVKAPVLGVCLGHQGICHALGGQIIHAPEPFHGRASHIYHHQKGLFAGIPQGFKAVRYHSLMAQRPLPDELKEVAWTPDGIVMAVEHRSRMMWGVQFHPESACTEFGKELLQNFIKLSVDYYRERGRKLIAKCPGIYVTANNDLLGDVKRESTADEWRVFTRKLDYHSDPSITFKNLYGDQPVSFWLDSSLVKSGLSRFSFMGNGSGPNSVLVRYFVSDRRLIVRKNGQELEERCGIFDYLNRELRRIHCLSPELPFDFNCGFVGYLGYEIKEECGGELAHISPFPDSTFLLADRMIVFDHLEQTTYLIHLGKREDEDAAEIWFDEIERRLHTITQTESPRAERQKACLPFILEQSRSQYLGSIQKSLKLIRDGESHEVCLTNKLRAKSNIDPLEFYRLLREVNPAPYSAFLRFPDVSVACSSPERFLSIDSAGMVESRPIKGTARRGGTPQEDERLRKILGADTKNRSENMMIVDLLRNDLGRVCEMGSIYVPYLMEVETYATVHQLVSSIRGRLKSGKTAVDCVQSAFPGGSMTGAPKIRVMEIIDQLETSARGIYSGTIGFFGANGSADLNIVIRTAVFGQDDISVGVGGAIVALSDPGEEFEETLLKFRAIFRAFRMMNNGPCTIEDGDRRYQI
jgi:para-aminobenzoate synthetase